LPLLAFAVEMFLFPFGGMRFKVSGVAGNVGDCFWAAIFGGAEDVRSRFLLLLRASTMMLPIIFQSYRCILVVVLRRWLLRLNKVWASSFQLGEDFVFHASVLSTASAGARMISMWSLCMCVVLSIFCKDLCVNWGYAVLLI
jgi:hypothetical protein